MMIDELWVNPVIFKASMEESTADEAPNATCQLEALDKIRLLTDSTLNSRHPLLLVDSGPP